MSRSLANFILNKESRIITEDEEDEMTTDLETDEDEADPEDQEETETDSSEDDEGKDDSEGGDGDSTDDDGEEEDENPDLDTDENDKKVKLLSKYKYLKTLNNDVMYILENINTSELDDANFKKFQDIKFSSIELKEYILYIIEVKFSKVEYSQLLYLYMNLSEQMEAITDSIDKLIPEQKDK